MTIAAVGDIEQLKQECANLVPNVSHADVPAPHHCHCLVCVYVISLVVNVQTLLPYEWVYGLMFRACEEAQSPEFGLQLWKGTT